MRVCGPCRTVGMSSTGHLLRSLRDPRTGETLDARIRDARVRLAPPKRPKDWHRLDVLPRTLTGKVLRGDLPR